MSTDLIEYVAANLVALALVVALAWIIAVWHEWNKMKIMINDYETQLAQWKAKHGLDPAADHNQDELRMAGEEQASKEHSWCLGCDKEMPVSEMKLITRGIDAYVQYDDGETDYIAPDCRVRMCPECFKEHYEIDK